MTHNPPGKSATATKTSRQKPVPSRSDILLRQRAFIDAACKKLGVDYTGLARKAGVAQTTITRPMNAADWSNLLSTRTLKKVAAAARVPLPSDVAGEHEAAAPPPRAVALTARGDGHGGMVITLPAATPGGQDALKLLQLYAAAKPEDRAAALMRLQHPGLLASGSPAPDDAAIQRMAEDTVDRLARKLGLTLDAPERLHQIADAITDIRLILANLGGRATDSAAPAPTRRAGAKVTAR
jgi:hypothetical protein